ncbi:hypothetical protein FRC07_006263, partial [Ceratobasidium sp. 392]
MLQDFWEQVYIPTPPPSPISAAQSLCNNSPIDLEEVETVAQSTGMASPLENGAAPPNNNLAVE